jgi:hypothetical protein
MKTATPAKDDTSIGILVVHGIGQQRPGETLARCCDALADWFARWIEGAARREPDRELEPVRVETATLADAEGAPPHAQLKVKFPGRAECRLTLAESWWAASFAPASFADLASWGFVVTPWAMLCHFGKRGALAAERVVQAERSGRFVARELLRATIEMLALTTACLIVAPLVLLLMLLLVVLGLLPIPWLHDFVVKQQRRLAATVGDSAVLLRSPTQEAAIVGKVRHDLEWLETKCGRVLVVAHSQGAAVSHEALRRLRSRKVHGFLTFGSGLSILADLRTPASLIPFLGLLGGGLAGIWWRFARPLDIVEPLWAAVAPAAVTLMVLGFIGALLHQYLEWRAVEGGVGLRGTGAEASSGLSRAEKIGPYLGFLGAVLALVLAIRSHTPWTWFVAAVLILCVLGWLASRWFLQKEAIDTLRRLSKASGVVRTTHHIMTTGFLTSGVALFATLPWGLLLIPAGFLLLGGLAHLRMWAERGEIFLSNHELDCTPLWKDFFASADPVSNGPFRDLKAREELANRRYPSDSVEVRNRASWLFDHVTYWANADEFVTYLAKEAGRVGEFDVEIMDNDSEWIKLARHRRGWRVAWLRPLRLVLAVLALGILLPSPWWTTFSEVAGKKAAAVSVQAATWGLMDSKVAKLIGHPVLLARTGFLLAAFLGYFLVWAVWWAWDRSDIQRFFDRGFRGARWAGYTSFPSWFVTFALCLLAYAGGAMWVVVAIHAGAKAGLIGVGIALAVLMLLALFSHKWLGEHFRRKSASGPILRAFCAGSEPEGYQLASLHKRRAEELQNEASRLERLESVTGERSDLNEHQRRHRRVRLADQRLALADEAIELAAVALEPARTLLLAAARALARPVDPSFVSSEKQLNKVRARLKTASSASSVTA